MSEHSEHGTHFAGQKYLDFPTMKEALIARRIEATFMIVPLAMKLAADGVPVKIVYLGHRDGSTFMVQKDGPITDFGGLRGKRVAIPSRFSNQALLLHKLMKQWHMEPGDIDLVEMPPPDMPSALQARAIDGYFVGEPHAARAELGGWGRVLYYAKDVWPDFISCALVVRQELIDEQRPLVQELVDGIAASGKWLDQDQAHRFDAADVVGRYYYNQDPELLKFVLSQPPDRVKFTDLKPLRENFDEIMQLANDTGVIEKHMPFDEYVDDSFAPDVFTLTVPFEHLPPGNAPRAVPATAAGGAR